MNRVEFGIGLSYRWNKTLLDNRDDRRDRALALAAEYFDGANYYEGKGVWAPGNGREPIFEDSATITIYTQASVYVIESFARHLREIYEQEAILVSITPTIHFTLVTEQEKVA